MVGIAALCVGVLVPADDADEMMEDTREETELNDDEADEITELALVPRVTVPVVVNLQRSLGTARTD